MYAYEGFDDQGNWTKRIASGDNISITILRPRTYRANTEASPTAAIGGALEDILPALPV